MWDTADVSRKCFWVRRVSGPGAVVSHISQKTSEIWGTRGFVVGLNFEKTLSVRAGRASIPGRFFLGRILNHPCRFVLGSVVNHPYGSLLGWILNHPCRLVLGWILNDPYGTLVDTWGSPLSVLAVRRV